MSPNKSYCSTIQLLVVFCYTAVHSCTAVSQFTDHLRVCGVTCLWCTWTNVPLWVEINAVVVRIPSHVVPMRQTKWQLMLPTGRPKSSLHIVYLWYDAGRVRTCHSGYEPGDGHACLCRRNTLRFRTRSARRYTICCEKCDRKTPKSAPH